MAPGGVEEVVKALLKILSGAFALFMVLAIVQEWDFFASAWFGETASAWEPTKEEREAAAETLALFHRISANYTRHKHSRFDTDRLIHHALFLGIVLNLDVTGQREVLAERVTDKTVVGKNTTKIGMTFEHDAVKIEGLALVPVSAAPDIHHRRHDRQLVIGRKHLDTQSMVIGNR